MTDSSLAPVDVLTTDEWAQLHPLERRMCEAILADLRKKHGDDYLRRNRELIRGQIEQVCGPLGDG